MCGLFAMPWASRYACSLSMFASARSRSMTTAGVSTSATFVPDAMSTYNHLQGDSALSSELLSEIEKRVRAAGTAERAAQEKRYLKSDLEHYGTSVPDLRKIEKAVLRESVPNDRESIMQLAGDLWARPVHEL